jgi:hypothetical protein
LEAEARKWQEALYRAELERIDGAVAAAEELLRGYVGAERFQEYQTQRRITVDSSRYRGRQYVVRPSGMIEVLEGGRVVDKLCVHLVDRVDDNGWRGYRMDGGWLPPADVVFGKVLLLELDEERLLRTANHNPVYDMAAVRR